MNDCDRCRDLRTAMIGAACVIAIGIFIGWGAFEWLSK
jgi:hypothetical protein